MANANTLSLPTIEQFLLGFDSQNFTKRQTFPCYDIIEEYDPNTNLPTTIRVDVALAGYSPDQLQVVVDGGRLTISTIADYKNTTQELAQPTKTIHRGITQRNFKVEFNLTPQLSDTPIVTFKDGILSVRFKYESQNKRVIPIIS